MYEAFFELNRRPFTASPQPDLYFPAKAIETARRAIERCIDRAEGTAMVMGPAGCGKSLLCGWLAERFRPEFHVVAISNGRLTTRRGLLQAILFELGLPYRGLDEAELRLALLDHLEQCVTSNTKGMLLIVDEAHILPQRLLEEVRMITDFIRGGAPRVRLVLAGASSLEERLATPRLHAFQQRIRARYYLEAMDRADTIGYIRHQITTVGGTVDGVFTDAALDAVYSATDGIPRLVNQTCDHALVLGSAGGVRPIDAPGIEEAWADLQQLPTPWSRKPGYADPQSFDVAQGGRGQAEVIEFGTLDDAGIPDEIPPAAHPLPAQPIAAASFADQPIAARPVIETSERLAAVLPLDTRREADDSLDELESHITNLETEFEPVVDRQPEVELVLGPTRRDPFTETFVQEEVVSDRYAAADRTITKRTTVYSSEGRSLSLLLEAGRRMREKAEAGNTGAPRSETPDAGNAAASTPPAHGRASAAKGAEPRPVIAPNHGNTDRVAPPTAPSGPATAGPATFGMSATNRSAILRPSTVRESSSIFHSDPVEPEDFVIVPKRPQRDADMIIIEDDPHPSPRHDSEASPVRKQDLRQMFARLRRNPSEKI